jgi:hypothetical protein
MRFIFLPTLLLSGCAAPATDIPSLAPRPIERADAAPAPSVIPPAPVALSEQQLARLTELVARAKADKSEFDRGLAALAPAISRGRQAARGSEAWVAAEQAASRLAQLLMPLTSAQADLDALVQTALSKGSSVRDPALISAQQQLSSSLAEAQRAAAAAR